MARARRRLKAVRLRREPAGSLPGFSFSLLFLSLLIFGFIIAFFLFMCFYLYIYIDLFIYIYIYEGGFGDEGRLGGVAEGVQEG